MSQHSSHFILALSLALGLTGCGEEYESNYRSGAIANAIAAADNLPRVPVRFKLPKRSDEPMLSGMTGYYYRLESEGVTCPAGESEEKLGTYVDGEEFTLNLTQACNYAVTLKFGVLAEPAPSPALTGSNTLNYQDTIKALVQTNCVSCHGDYTDFAVLKAKGDLVVQHVEAGTMPKSGALNDLDIAKFLAWKDGGYLENSPNPPPSPLEAGLTQVYFRNNHQDFLMGVELKTRSQFELRRSLWLQPEGQEAGIITQELQSYEPFPSSSSAAFR